MPQRELYELAHHAGAHAAGQDPHTAMWLRSLTYPDEPEQTAGWLDGLATAQPKPAAAEPSWLAVTVTAAYNTNPGLGRAA